SMEKAALKSADELLRWITERNETNDIHFVLTDLPAADLKQLAHGLADRSILLFNISAPDDSLRGADCSANVVHTYPSEAMLLDAFMQYLVAKKWTKILVLQGPAPQDAEMVAALQRSARKFHATVVEIRPFQLSNDPRNREQNNILLMTADVRYDVV